MGRKKELNPMEAYRRKQKKAQLAKNKKKRADAKDKALQRRNSEWIMTEIQKLNRREKQDHGKNEEKYTNQRKKLLEAYNRAVRIQKIKEKTQRNTSKHDDDDNNNNNNESSPAPPPIEQIEDISNMKTNKNNTNNHNIKPINTSNNIPSIINPNSNPNPIPIHPNPNIYSHLYHNSLLMNPYQMASIYSDTLGAKSNVTHSMYGQSSINPYNEKQQRVPKDALDPMNPANPKYNFIHSHSKQIHSLIHPPPNIKPQPPFQQQLKPKQQQQQIQQKQNEDITKMEKPKHEIEVIMDPKLKAMMPSSMRFKRKFEKPKPVRPKKKRKLNIAPDVDKDDDNHNANNSNNNNNINNRNITNNFSSGNADAAYDKFLDEISGLI